MASGIPNRLHPYRQASYALQQLAEYINNDSIDLQASYQRAIVWGKAKQIKFITSVFHNYPIPPILFAVVQSRDGEEIRVCIDGKQRLTAIQRFVNGQIPYKNSATGEKLFYTNSTDSAVKVLSNQQKALFDRWQMFCVEYDAITIEQQREVYQRVQLGMPLKSSDKLLAVNGPYANLIRSLLNEFGAIDGIACKPFPWDKITSPSSKFETVSAMLYLLSGTRRIDKPEPTTLRLEEFLAQQTLSVDDENLGVEVSEAMTILVALFRGSDNLSFSTLAFIFSVVLVHRFFKLMNCNQRDQAHRHCIRDHVINLIKAIRTEIPDHKQTTDNLATCSSILQRIQASFSCPCVLRAKGNRQRAESLGEGPSNQKKITGTATIKKPLVYRLSPSPAPGSEQPKRKKETRLARRLGSKAGPSSICRP